MADNPLRQGHAAWVWIDLGEGARWELAVPAENCGPYDVHLPLVDRDYDFQEIDDCPMRQIGPPEDGPTEAEIAAADPSAATHGVSDDDHG